MIIFGWRSKGEPEWTGLLRCGRCQDWAICYGVRVKRFFTLFFIPLIPLWSDTKVICSICLYEHQLGPAEFAQAEELGQFYYNLAVLARENPQKYEEVVSKLSQAETPVIGEPAVRNPQMEVGDRVCRSCGTLADPGENFCSNCGARL